MSMISSELLYKAARPAESVTPGHPDKMCDQMADTLVDMVLPGGPQCRMAAEVTGGHKKVFVTGECQTVIPMDQFQEQAAAALRRVYGEVTHNPLDDVIMHMVVQSPDIAVGVDPGGAGDQGVMVGYATDETPEMLPKPFALARAITHELYRRALAGDPAWMEPDGKSLVVLKGDVVTSLTIAIQHAANVSQDEIRTWLIDNVILPKLGYVPEHFVLNGTGIFCIGGFEADAGTTGRKLVVDAYGPEVPIGGGAYSGKDPTKVDRSAAYMARYVAKNIVVHGVAGAHRAMVQISYAIGKPEPTGLLAVTDTGAEVSDWVRDHFDLRPRAIIESLNLWQPRWRQVCIGGHYGKDHRVMSAEEAAIWTWEQVRTDL